MMDTCPKCQFAIEPGAVECPACGVILAKLKSTTTPPPRPAPPKPVDPYALPVLRITPKAPRAEGEPAPAPIVPVPPPAPAATVPTATAPAAPAARPNPYAPPPRRQPANPYAPPKASIEAPEPPVPTGDPVTPRTVEALKITQPWLRLVVRSGFGLSALFFLGGVSLFVANKLPPEIQAMSFFYFLFAGIMVALVLPVRRSADTLDWLDTHEPNVCLEAYAQEQAELWRRTAVIHIALFVVIVASIVWAVKENAL